MSPMLAPGRQAEAGVAHPFLQVGHFGDLFCRRYQRILQCLLCHLYLLIVRLAVVVSFLATFAQLVLLFP